MSLALRSATSSTRFDWLSLSTTPSAQIQVLAAKAEKSSRFAGFSGQVLLAECALDCLLCHLRALS